MLHTALGAANVAALINLGGNPLVGLVVLILICGFAWVIWTKAIMPLLTPIIGEPFLGIVNWIVIAVLVIIVVSRLLEVVFGISLFGGMN